jgi:hypothetical protein
MSIDSKSEQIIDLMHQPWALIKESGNMGIKGVKRFFLIVFLFAISNFILDIYAMVSFISADYTNTKLINLFLILLTGIVITTFAGYKAYQYLLINAANAIYINSQASIKNLCTQMVLKADHFFRSESFKNKTSKLGLESTKSFIDGFFVKQPSLLKKGFQRILNRAPIAQLLLDARKDILNGNHQDSSDKIFGLIDNFLTQNVFETNNTRWVGWLLPTNILMFYLWIDLLIS